jgi:transcription termination/antitermination protein NusG
MREEPIVSNDENEREREKEWFVVHTFSGYENSVKRALEERIKGKPFEDQFGEILVPSEQVTERRGKRNIKTSRKFFPGYIFVSMELTKESWHVVKNTPKVTGFLGDPNPKPIRQAEMNRMLGHTTGQLEPSPEAPPAPEVHYKVGDQVRVRSGAFANFAGEVEEVNNDKQKIWLSVSIFGRPTRVEVDFAEVELSQS